MRSPMTSRSNCAKDSNTFNVKRPAARARSLRAEATTRWLKEHLEGGIVRHEQIVEEIERASEPDANAASPQDESFALASETPRPVARGLHQIPFGTTGRLSGLNAGD
jgi:hypothetical protein